jgi:hypothetical protein
MQYTDEEIKLARQLRDEGLFWEPRAGHYVYDETGFCKQPSPFQEGVYFILNYPYFMKAVGGVERFKEIMIWLPTWYDAREILRENGLADQQIVDHLCDEHAIERGTERLALYQMILSSLRSKAAADAFTRDE